MRKRLSRNGPFIIYALALAALFFLLRWLELRLLIFDHAFEVYIGAIALLFTGLGIWLAVKLMTPKTVVVEKPVIVPEKPFAINTAAMDASGISRRELEVLELMARGLSNRE